MNIYEKCGFLPAKVLLPKKGTDMSKWSVIACDQYTSNKSYWDDVQKITDGAPSAYSLVLPEIYLSSDDVEKRVEKINATMTEYIDGGVFNEYGEAYIYVERTLPDGSVRHGIVGMLDLELYDFSKGSESRVRATEGTITERIPPRLKVRKDAALELPHIMILIDDAKKEIIESLSNLKSDFEKLYDFELMKNGGRIAGYRIPQDICEKIAEKLSVLADEKAFCEKYGAFGKGVLQYAVGDGNHSLATAKTHYEQNKNEITRYALCELVNLHDTSLVFEAIHRTVFDTDVNALVAALLCEYPSAKLSDKPEAGAQNIKLVSREVNSYFVLTAPKYKLSVATLQNFLDKYLSSSSGKLDYIHGEAEATELASRENTISFILDAMDKSELYPAVIADGALPRKTFSMGDADTKRFYTEARKIK